MKCIEEQYVVLDVETNGLSSKKNDLLSISIYKPDDGKIYNRFLPLELESNINPESYTVNGIKKKDLKGKKSLNQKEVYEIIDEFDLRNRKILTYGSLDQKFIEAYFKRKNLLGLKYLKFINFKRKIISSRFSGGNVTKDNLCRLFKIDNVNEVHSGINDCILEWKLFKKIYDKTLLITNNKVFEMHDDYIIPASIIYDCPNLKYYKNIHEITVETELVKRFDIEGDNIKKFPTNFNGIIIEQLINKMLNVKKFDSIDFLLENKMKLDYIGQIPSSFDEIPLVIKEDGFVVSKREKDESYVNELNGFIDDLKREMIPLIKFIKIDVFKNKTISSQELVINEEDNILALCDLSTNDSILEIKSNNDVNNYKEQLFYESNGRDCYIMVTNWLTLERKMSIEILKVSFIKENYFMGDTQSKRKQNFQSRLEPYNIQVLEYTNSKSPIKLKCNICHTEWTTSYNKIMKKAECPICHPKEKSSSKVKNNIEKKITKKSIEEKNRIRLEKYNMKLNEKSNGTLIALNYTGAKEKAEVKCCICGHVWLTRADHLLERCQCPVCKKRRLSWRENND